MKNKYLFFTLFSILSFVSIYSTSAIKKSAGAPPYYSGAPSEETCSAVGCHDGVTGTDNSGIGSCNIIFNNGDNTYTTGDTFTVKVNIQQAGATKFGFQIVTLRKSNNNPAGNAYITDVVRTQRRDNSNVSWGCCPNRQWIEHTADGNIPTATAYNEWTYKWVAPSTNIGDVTFYLAALAGNGNGTDSMDYTYTKKLTISYKAKTAIQPVPKRQEIKVSVFPNPTDGFIKVFLPEIKLPAQIVIADIKGKKIYAAKMESNLTEISTIAWANGFYILSIEDMPEVRSTRFEIRR